VGLLGTCSHRLSVEVLRADAQLNAAFLWRLVVSYLLLALLCRKTGGTDLVLVGPQVRAAALWARFTVDVGVDVGFQVGDNGGRYAG